MAAAHRTIVERGDDLVGHILCLVEMLLAVKALKGSFHDLIRPGLFLTKVRLGVKRHCRKNNASALSTRNCQEKSHRKEPPEIASHCAGCSSRAARRYNCSERQSEKQKSRVSLE